MSTGLKKYRVSYYRLSDYKRAASTNGKVPVITKVVEADSLRGAWAKFATPARFVIDLARARKDSYPNKRVVASKLPNLNLDEALPDVAINNTDVDVTSAFEGAEEKGDPFAGILSEDTTTDPESENAVSAMLGPIGVENVPTPVEIKPVNGWKLADGDGVSRSKQGTLVHAAENPQDPKVEEVPQIAEELGVSETEAEQIFETFDEETILDDSGDFEELNPIPVDAPAATSPAHILGDIYSDGYASGYSDGVEYVSAHDDGHLLDAASLTQTNITNVVSLLLIALWTGCLLKTITSPWLIPTLLVGATGVTLNILALIYNNDRD